MQPFPVDEIFSRGRQKHGISEGYRTEYQIFGGEVAKKQKFLKVVRFKVRISEGKKQKSKKFLRVVGLKGEFSEGFGVKRAFF